MRSFRRAYFRVIVKQPYREDYLVSPATNEVIRVNRLIDQAAILSHVFHPFANERCSHQDVCWNAKKIVLYRSINVVSRYRCKKEKVLLDN